MSYEKITEYVDSGGATLQVDAEAGLIRGVKILGYQSANGRTYAKETVARAKGLYEGAKVNVDHPTGDPSKPRSYGSRLGYLENIELREGEAGLFGDLRFNPKHALAEQLIYDATHMPANVGLSHNVLAKTSRRSGKPVVEEITRVQSVDLVADPATTRGLFEATNGLPPDRKETDMAETLTLEGLKADYPALVEEISTNAVEAFKASEEQKAKEANLAKLQEELDGYKVKERLAEQREAVATLIEEAKLPEAAVTDLFVEQLIAAEPDARAALIEDRRELVKPNASAKPQSKEQHTSEGGGAQMTTEELGRRWTA